MADSTLNQFVARGTNAERLAFTPSPPTPASGNDPGYFFYETDTGNTYAWDGAAWDQVNAATSFASTTEVLTGTNTTKAVNPDALAALWEQGSDVASASTISLGEGGYFNITGTTTITDVDFGTDKAGRKAWVKFAGILTFTNGANLILPTGANITTAAGDTAELVSEGSDTVRCVAYTRADGTPLAGGGSGVPDSAMFEDQKAANTSGGASTSGSWIARTLNTEVYDDIGLSLRSATVTLAVASPGVVGWTAHGLILNSTVVFTTTGALPTGLTAGTTYYVISAGLTADAFEVSATPGGAAINFTGSESGTHTATASVISLAAGTYEVEAYSSIYDSDMARMRLRDTTNSTTLALSVNFYASAANNVHAFPLVHGRFTLAGTALVELQYRVTQSTATNGLGVLSNWGEVETYCRLKLTKLS